MTEELVTFETAKLAKEVGFDIDTHWVLYKGTSTVLHKCPAIPTKGQDITDYSYILLPSQSLLHKWLRDEYNVHLILFHYPSSFSYRYRVEYPYWYNKYPEKFESRIEYSNEPHCTKYKEISYEEALEEGLQEALKMINE